MTTQINIDNLYNEDNTGFIFQDNESVSSFIQQNLMEYVVLEMCKKLTGDEKLNRRNGLYRKIIGKCQSMTDTDINLEIKVDIPKPHLQYFIDEYHKRV